VTDEQQDLIEELTNPLVPNTTKEHPHVASLPQPPAPSAFWAAEYERISKNIPLDAIDAQRYQISSDAKANLVSAEYTTSRADNLALLETYGSNSWLIGNAIQEHSLGLLETELAQLKEEGIKVNRERKQQNLALGGQLDDLERRWRKALRGVVEVEIANAALELEVKELEGQQTNS
jgi:pre-mRNA-splicing factor SPF27